MRSHLLRRFALIAMATAILTVAFERSRAADPQQNKVPDKSRASTQPDYRVWQTIKKGMEESEVVKLLGGPLAKPDAPFDRNGDVLYFWDFAYIARESIVFPHSLGFRVRFKRGKVYAVDDPFDGKFSKDGSPTVPKPSWPAQPPVYSHYPRTMDFRWNPSSWVYPMRYEVEVSNVQSRDANGEWVWRVDRVYKSEVPYACGDFIDRVPGRWRVRAINEKAAGEWSDYCKFSFTR